MASVSQNQLNCDICLDVATEAVDSDCCHHLFCSACVQNVTVCPICRKARIRYTANHVLRRIIGDLPVSCDFTGCTATVTRSNADSHRQICPFGNLTCPINGCDAKMIPAEFMAHLVTVHKLTDNRERPAVGTESPNCYHLGVKCNGCGQQPIKNRRHKCLICPNYDLCDKCEGQRFHEQHLMIRISDPADTSWEAIARFSQRAQLLSLPILTAATQSPVPSLTTTTQSAVPSLTTTTQSAVPSLTTTTQSAVPSLTTTTQSLVPSLATTAMSTSNVENNNNVGSEPLLIDLNPVADAQPSFAMSELFATVLASMTSMGFTNEDGWLYSLIESKDGDINAVLSTLSHSPTESSPMITNHVEPASTQQSNNGTGSEPYVCGDCDTIFGSRFARCTHILETGHHLRRSHSDPGN